MVVVAGINNYHTGRNLSLLNEELAVVVAVAIAAVAALVTN